MKSGSWSSWQAALPVEARAGGEPDEDRPSPYSEWERRMSVAFDSPCNRLGTPEAEGPDCPCPPCRLATAWENLDALERGLLFAGMRDQGFFWPGHE